MKIEAVKDKIKFIPEHEFDILRLGWLSGRVENFIIVGNDIQRGISLPVDEFVQYLFRDNDCVIAK